MADLVRLVELIARELRSARAEGGVGSLVEFTTQSSFSGLLTGIGSAPTALGSWPTR